MKTDPKDFRVSEGNRVSQEWPTKIDPVYKSKHQYKKMLEKHIAAAERATTSLHIDSIRNPVDFPGDGCGGGSGASGA